MMSQPSRARMCTSQGVTEASLSTTPPRSPRQILTRPTAWCTSSTKCSFHQRHQLHLHHLHPLWPSLKLIHHHHIRPAAKSGALQPVNTWTLLLRSAATERWCTSGVPTPASTLLTRRPAARSGPLQLVMV